MHPMTTRRPMRTRFPFGLLALGAGFLVIVPGCGGSEDPASTDEGSGSTLDLTFALPADPANYQPLAGYEAMMVPSTNPITSEKAALGHALFFDERLSGDGKLSCYSCHLNDKGLSDGRTVAVGAFEKTLTFNTPSLWNIGFHQRWYWNGRADTLEGQAGAAWKGGNMGAGKEPASFGKTVDAINAVPAYRAAFQKIFGEPANDKNIPMALATYMRTIIGGRTAYDRWKAGDDSAVSDAAKRGEQVFKQAKCDNCHAGLLFSDLQFHNVGIGLEDKTFEEGSEKPTSGRFGTSGEEKDRGAFKTPSLRDVVDSAPYFHDGSRATLEDAVRFMVGGGHENPWLDRANLEKRELSEEQIQDLIAFLKTLDEEGALESPAVPR